MVIKSGQNVINEKSISKPADPNIRLQQKRQAIKSKQEAIKSKQEYDKKLSKSVQKAISERYPDYTVKEEAGRYILEAPEKEFVKYQFKGDRSLTERSKYTPERIIVGSGGNILKVERFQVGGITSRSGRTTTRRVYQTTLQEYKDGQIMRGYEKALLTGPQQMGLRTAVTYKQGQKIEQKIKPLGKITYAKRPKTEDEVLGIDEDTSAENIKIKERMADEGKYDEAITKAINTGGITFSDTKGPVAQRLVKQAQFKQTSTDTSLRARSNLSRQMKAYETGLQVQQTVLKKLGATSLQDLSEQRRQEEIRQEFSKPIGEQTKIVVAPFSEKAYALYKEREPEIKAIREKEAKQAAYYDYLKELSKKQKQGLEYKGISPTSLVLSVAIDRGQITNIKDLQTYSQFSPPQSVNTPIKLKITNIKYTKSGDKVTYATDNTYLLEEYGLLREKLLAEKKELLQKPGMKAGFERAIGVIKEPAEFREARKDIEIELERRGSKKTFGQKYVRPTSYFVLENKEKVLTAATIGYFSVPAITAISGGLASITSPAVTTTLLKSGGVVLTSAYVTSKGVETYKKIKSEPQFYSTTAGKIELVAEPSLELAAFGAGRQAFKLSVPVLQKIAIKTPGVRDIVPKRFFQQRVKGTRLSEGKVAYERTLKQEATSTGLKGTAKESILFRTEQFNKVTQTKVKGFFRKVGNIQKLEGTRYSSTSRWVSVNKAPVSAPKGYRFVGGTVQKYRPPTLRKYNYEPNIFNIKGKGVLRKDVLNLDSSIRSEQQIPFKKVIDPSKFKVKKVDGGLLLSRTSDVSKFSFDDIVVRIIGQSQGKNLPKPTLVQTFRGVGKITGLEVERMAYKSTYMAPFIYPTPERIPVKSTGKLQPVLSSTTYSPFLPSSSYAFVGFNVPESRNIQNRLNLKDFNRQNNRFKPVLDNYRNEDEKLKPIVNIGPDSTFDREYITSPKLVSGPALTSYDTTNFAYEPDADIKSSITYEPIQQTDPTPIPVPDYAPPDFKIEKRQRPKPKPPSFPRLRFPKFQTNLTQKQEAYNAYVKERGRYIKVNKQPLPRNKALGLGSDVTDNTAAATFKIKPTGGKTKQRDSLGWSDKFKFRKKSGSKNTYIELDRNRIDTPGEIQGITVKGWLAKKRKKQSGGWF